MTDFPAALVAKLIRLDNTERALLAAALMSGCEIHSIDIGVFWQSMSPLRCAELIEVGKASALDLKIGDAPFDLKG